MMKNEKYIICTYKYTHVHTHMSSAEQQNEFIDTDDERESPTEIVQESVDQAIEESPTEIVQEIHTKTDVIRDSTSSTFHQYISK